MDPLKFTNEEEVLIKKISESAKDVVLNMQEKSEIKNKLSSYVESNTLSATKPVVSKYYRVDDFLGLLSWRPIYAFSIALFILVSSGVGTSLVAQNSLPGDTLYPVKTGFNENLESFLAFTPETQAEVNLKQVSTRLNEVETLSNSGDLTEVQTEKIQSNFSKKIEALNKSIDKVKNKGNKKVAEKVSSDFEKEIDDHFNAFVTISNSASNSPTFAGIFESRKSRSGDTTIMMTSTRISSPTKSDDDEVENEDIDERHRGDDDEEEDDDDDDRGGSIVLPTPTEPTTTPVATYSLVEVSKHNNLKDCWTTISGGVYDLTKWIAQHPGGESAILGTCGIDATDAFLAQHSGEKRPTDTLKSFKIGELSK